MIMAECVKVIVRCRPLNQREKDLKCEHVIETDERIGQCRIKKPGDNQPPKTFTFDGVFDIDSVTESIYADICFPIIEGIVEGYNGTVFAYGQTGCGKSFSMQGIETPPTQRGIIPRAFEHVFESIHVSDNSKFLVNASYLEIYNEEIRDLLAKDQKLKLDVKEHPEKGVYVKDLSMNTCHNIKDMEKLMGRGGQNRSVGATLMNADSSRSHSIFTIYVETCESGGEGEEHIRAGKLNLVDLAGSERQAKTGATGDRLKEATKINLSLSALGNVISALVDGKSKHIPYRDSKLTRLLQDSLGGNTKTLMVACISPADNNYEETLSTLRYANRAKNIKNKPKINEDPKDALLRQYQDEINLLKQLLTGQLQMSNEITMKLGLTGRGTDSTVQSTSTVDMSHQRLLENDSNNIKANYDEKLRILQKQFEQEQLQKIKLTEEVSQLQYDLNAKLKAVPSNILPNDAPESTFLEISSNLQKTDEAVDVDNFGLDVQLPNFSGSNVVHMDVDDKTDTPSIANKLLRVESMQDDSGTAMKEEAAKRLNSLQKHLVKSEPQIDKEELKRKHCKRRKHFNERQQIMLKEVKKWEGEGIMVQVYDSLQDEIKDKNTKISSLETELVVAKVEISDLQEEFQSERFDYLDTIRKLEKQVMLQHQILDKVQPTIRRDCNYFNLEKIKAQSEFNEESQIWDVPDLVIERTSLPKTIMDKHIMQYKEGGNKDDVEKCIAPMSSHLNEDLSSNYFKPMRAEKLLSNSSSGVNCVHTVNNNNIFKLTTSKSPLPELTRRPLKLDALPLSTFDKKKKKLKNKNNGVFMN